MDYVQVSHKNLETVPIVLSDDEIENVKKPKHTSEKRSKKKHTPKRKVKINNSDEGETLVVTQKVKVKKQKIQCIINLTKYEACQRKSTIPQNNPKCTNTRRNKDRVVPHCRRDKCFTAISKKCKYMPTFENKLKTKEKSHSNEKPKHSPNKRSSFKTKLNRKNVKADISYEDISSDSLKGTEVEDVSSDSFKATDDELDVLIKRTKDRERRLSKTFDLKPPLGSSTPILVSSGSEADVANRSCETIVSFHSAKTLLLEPRSDAYSPNHLNDDALEKIEWSPRVLEIDDSPMHVDIKDSFRLSEDIKPTELEIKKICHLPANTFENIGYSKASQENVNPKSEPQEICSDHGMIDNDSCPLNTFITIKPTIYSSSETKCIEKICKIESTSNTLSKNDFSENEKNMYQNDLNHTNKYEVGIKTENYIENKHFNIPNSDAKALTDVNKNLLNNNIKTETKDLFYSVSGMIDLKEVKKES